MLTQSDRLLVILSHFHNARGIICLRPSYSRNSKHCMSFFNLNSSCIFVCHFINCFNCCIYEWHSWLGNLKKLKLGNRDAAYKVPLWNRDQPFNLKKGAELWYYGKITLFWVFPWKLLELSRNRRNFNIITNYTNHIFNYFPYNIILWWKKTVWKEIFNFFLFRCYGNQASLLNL